MEKFRLGLKNSMGKEIYYNNTTTIQSLLKSCENNYNAVQFKHIRNSYIKTAYSNNAIDGYLTRADTVSVAVSRVPKNKAQRTVLNTINLIESGILEEREWSHGYIIKVWYQLNDDALNYLKLSDAYRKSSVRIGVGKLGAYINPDYVAPHYIQVPYMMDSLIDFAKRTDLNPFIQSIAFSFYFVYVHPFLDGNGRTSRLLMTKLLVDKGLYKFRYLYITSSILKSHSAYVSGLEASEHSIDGNITEYITIMLRIFNRLFRLALRDFDTLSTTDTSKLTHRESIMLNYLISSKQSLNST